MFIGSRDCDVHIFKGRFCAIAVLCFLSLFVLPLSLLTDFISWCMIIDFITSECCLMFLLVRLQDFTYPLPYWQTSRWPTFPTTNKTIMNSLLNKSLCNWHGIFLEYLPNYRITGQNDTSILNFHLILPEFTPRQVAQVYTPSSLSAGRFSQTALLTNT